MSAGSELVKVGQDPRLDSWLRFLHALDCKCDYGWRSLGRWDGIAMGKGWVRITTHPKCPEHALCQGYTPEIEAAHKRTHPWSIGRWCPVHKNRGCPPKVRPSTRSGGDDEAR